jgi:hypothetical protein
MAVTSTPARNSFLRAHVVFKLETGIHRHIDSEFRHTPKIFQGVLSKHILKYGRLTVYVCSLTHLYALSPFQDINSIFSGGTK